MIFINLNMFDKFRRKTVENLYEPFHLNRIKRNRRKLKWIYSTRFGIAENGPLNQSLKCLSVI